MYWLCTCRWRDNTCPSRQHHPQSTELHCWHWLSRRPHHGVSVSWLVPTFVFLHMLTHSMHIHSFFFSRWCARAPKDHHPSRLLESQWCNHGFCHPGSDLCTCVQCADLCLVEEEVTHCDSVAKCCCCITVTVVYVGLHLLQTLTMNIFLAHVKFWLHSVLQLLCNLLPSITVHIVSTIVSHWWSKNT